MQSEFWTISKTRILVTNYLHYASWQINKQRENTQKKQSKKSRQLWSKSIPFHYDVCNSTTQLTEEIYFVPVSYKSSFHSLEMISNKIFFLWWSNTLQPVKEFCQFLTGLGSCTAQVTDGKQALLTVPHGPQSTERQNRYFQYIIIISRQVTFEFHKCK